MNLRDRTRSFADPARTSPIANTPATLVITGSKESGVESVTWEHRDMREKQTRPIHHVLLFLGADPCTEWLKDCDVAVDATGFVATGHGNHRSLAPAWPPNERASPTIPRTPHILPWTVPRDRRRRRRRVQLLRIDQQRFDIADRDGADQRARAGKLADLAGERARDAAGAGADGLSAVTRAPSPLHRRSTSSTIFPARAR